MIEEEDNNYEELVSYNAEPPVQQSPYICLFTLLEIKDHHYLID